MKLKASQAHPQPPTLLVDLSDIATLRMLYARTVAADTRVFPDEQDLLAKIMDGRCPETTLCENCEGSAQFMPREHFGVHHHSE